MNKRRMNITVLFVVVGITITGFSGCVTAKFTEPVMSFQRGIDKTSFIIADYYEKTNEFERDFYLNECLFNPEKELLLYDNGKPTPLLNGILSSESIKARSDALVLIGIYANRLGDLANNDSPEVFSRNSFVLGDNLQNLGKTFNELSDSDIDAVQYSGPVSKIVGLVGEMFMESSRDKAIENAVKTGHPAVNKILNQLQNDLNNVIIPIQKSGLKQKISEMSVYYNENRKKLTQTRRRTELSRINKVIVQYNTLINSNPSNLIQELKQANDALAEYAESSRTPKDLAELVSVLDKFNSDVQLFASM